VIASAIGLAVLIHRMTSLTVLLTVVVSVLAMLDRSFGVGTLVQPSEMRQAITLLFAGHQPLDPATVPRHTPEVARLG
jgi:hypothetical protein